MVFDDHDFSSTAAERFDADGASACERGRESGSRGCVQPGRWKRFAEAIAGRAKGKALEAFKLAAAKCPAMMRNGGF